VRGGGPFNGDGLTRVRGGPRGAVCGPRTEARPLAVGEGVERRGGFNVVYRSALLR